MEQKKREEKKPYDENVENGLWKFLCGEHWPNEGLVLYSLIKMIYILLVAAVHLLCSFSLLYLFSWVCIFSFPLEKNLR